jgi:Cdc6-like AAA superfamily ATPase
LETSQFEKVSTRKEEYIDRPAAKNEIKEYLDMPYSATFLVMIGSHGTGKTTLVKQLASEASGVVYVSIEEASSPEEMMISFSNSFATAVGWLPRKASFLDLLTDRFLPSKDPLAGEKSPRYQHYCMLTSLRVAVLKSDTLKSMFDDFEAAAVNYYRKYGRCVTLIFDDTNRLSTGELPVSLSGPIANPTTRQKSFLTLMNSKPNRLWGRDPPVYCNLLSSCDRTSEQKSRCRVVGFAIGPDRLTESSPLLNPVCSIGFSTALRRLPT